MANKASQVTIGVSVPSSLQGKGTYLVPEFIKSISAVEEHYLFLLEMPKRQMVDAMELMTKHLKESLP